MVDVWTKTNARQILLIAIRSPILHKMTERLVKGASRIDSPLILIIPQNIIVETRQKNHYLSNWQCQAGKLDQQVNES